MSWFDEVPAEVVRLIRTCYVAEFATVSAAGVPLNTPLVPFESADLATIDSATGLAYPVKADRARRNPKVGMLFEGEADEPVVSLSGMAGVKDRDLQANLERYLAEQILTRSMSPDLIDYQTVTRQAIWYFTRIITCVAPAVIRWWPNPAAMDGPPQEWRAPAGTAWPQSDPAPAGAGSKSSWQLPDWRDLAKGALARGAAAHLTLLDAEGYPLPIRARAIELTGEGFRMDMPQWLPWSEGQATVSFQGLETFIGGARVEDGAVLFRADRALPIHPLIVGGPLQPDEATKRALLERIAYELGRRGLALPVMPAEPPQPTAGARLRAEASFAFDIEAPSS
jgi:hypothetical protein